MFQRIRDEKPEVFKKLIPVQGDVTFDGEFDLLFLTSIQPFDAFHPVQVWD